MKFGFKRIFFLAATAMLAGCATDRADKTDASISLEGYEYDCIMELPDSLAVDVEGGRYVHVTGQGMLPTMIGGEGMESVRDSLMRLGGLSEMDHAGSVPIVPEGYKLTNIEDKEQAGSTRLNQLTVTLITPHLVVWRDYSYTYLCRSAHGMYTTTYVNYSIDKRKILTLEDLFKDNYREPLAQLIRTELRDENISITVPLEEVEVPSDFEITETGIRFVYPLYEIAPYVEGEVKVDLASYELSDLLKEGVEDMLWHMAD